MVKSRPTKIPADQSIAVGYGSLISVTPLGEKEAVLWFQDSGGTLRAIRVGYDVANGLALEVKGQAVVERT